MLALLLAISMTLKRGIIITICSEALISSFCLNLRLFPRKKTSAGGSSSSRVSRILALDGGSIGVII